SEDENTQVTSNQAVEPVAPAHSLVQNIEAAAQEGERAEQRKTRVSCRPSEIAASNLDSDDDEDESDQEHNTRLVFNQCTALTDSRARSAYSSARSRG